jgi:preprotein translocase subunit SecY
MFRIPELKKRILITLGFLAVYRIGFSIPIPGVKFVPFLNLHGFGISEAGGFARFIQQISAITGGDWLGGSIFALGIMPYISASIIFSLLQKIIPSLEQMAKEGEAGQQRLNQYSRYSTVALCFVQAYFVYTKLSRGGGPTDLLPAEFWGIGAFFQVFLALTAGTIFVMWIGERITEYGIGNGISMIIMAGIVARMPRAAFNIYNKYFSGNDPNSRPETGVLISAGLILGYVLIVMAVIIITQGTRKITIQQAKHVRGTRVYGGQRSYLGLRVNQAGVMPVIFASPVMQLFSSVLIVGAARALGPRWLWFGDILRFLFHNFSGGGVFYVLLETALIFFFAYFWTALYFNPKETAKNIKEYGSFIPGIRPGGNTSDYLEKIMNRVTLGGAAFLSAISVLPMLLSMSLGLDYIVVGFLGGTGILIVVGVALDIVQKIESHLVMRHYDGFLGAGKRIRGRRR